MTEFEHPHPRELVAEFALGVLPEEDAARVRAFLATDADALAEFEEMASVARLLPLAAEESEPSLDLRPAVMERIHRQPVPFQRAQGQRNRRPGWVLPLGAAAAAVLVIAAGIGGFAIGTGGGDEESQLRAQLAGSEQLLESVAQGRHQSAQGSAGDLRVSVVRSPGSAAAYAYVEGLPALASGQAYQSWFIADGQAPEPGPLFTTRNGAVWLEASQDISRYSAMAFTVEPEAGVKSPSRDPFVIVPLQKAAHR